MSVWLATLAADPHWPWVVPERVVTPCMTRMKLLATMPITAGPVRLVVTEPSMMMSLAAAIVTEAE